MTLTPIALRGPAVRDALVRRGMDTTHAEAAASGLVPLAILFDDVPSDISHALLEAAQRQQVDALTGEGWVLLAGSAARLAGLSRPGFGTLPQPLADELGQAVGSVVAPTSHWVTARGTIPLDRPVVAGILNVTPDSFSDGGRYFAPEAALRHAAALVEEGADLLDVGAESTRPGQPAPVPVEEEWRRLEPVLTRLSRELPRTPITVDTVKGEIARRSLDLGAWAINDVSGLRLDPTIADACGARGAGLILMHSRGTTEEMATYERAVYRDVVSETRSELAGCVRTAEAHGVARDHIVVDPGLGFAKTPEQNYAVLRGLSAFATLGCAVMVGPSRKRFLGALTGDEPADRDRATAAACVAAYLQGATLFRVHAVKGVREALDVARAIRSE